MATAEGAAIWKPLDPAGFGYGLRDPLPHFGSSAMLGRQEATGPAGEAPSSSVRLGDASGARRVTSVGDLGGKDFVQPVISIASHGP